MSNSNATRETETPHKAGAFDIRNFIGLLIGFYGIVLVFLGIFDDSAAERARADGLNLNLWAGLGMIVVAALFLVWARMKPVIVPAHPGEDAAEPAEGSAGGEPPSQAK